MSEREQIQNQIVEFLESKGKFNAPYGIIEGMEPYGKGKVRTVTFGIARYLDATIEIIKPNDIHVRGRGPLAHKYCGRYESFEKLKQAFDV